MNNSEFTRENQFWNNSYLLDIPMIDKQHKKFFDLFDKLYSLNNNGESFEKLKDVIDELEKYTNIHFKTEETLMTKANVIDTEEHIMQHKVFEKKILEFETAYSYKNQVLLNEMVVFMRKWFLLHISQMDKKYVDQVKTYLEERNL